jgi:hypothetical protein
MSKVQNRNMGRKRTKGGMTPQKTNNNIKEDLVEREGDESPGADLRIMMIRLSNAFKEELKENILNAYQMNMDKNLKKT